MKTLLNFINGKWQEPKSDRWMERENPATGEFLTTFPDSGEADVHDAVMAAAAAWECWRATPAPRRAEVLFRAGQLLADKKDEIVQDIMLETGKVRKESIAEVQAAIDCTYYWAGEGRRLFGQVTTSELPNKVAMVIRQPHGVIAAIPSWNFPVMLGAWKLMPALIAGNTVVLKPSPYAPAGAYRLVSILEEAGVPPGVVNLVFGGAEAGSAVVEHRDVRLVAFTGSLEIGRHIATRCAQLDKRVQLELGGKNALIILDDADLDVATEAAVWSAFATSGQRCSCASRILVQKSIASEMTDRLVRRALAINLGNSVDPAVEIGPLISRSQLERVEQYMEIALKEGASVASGGTRATDGDLARGYFFQPTVLVDVRPDMAVAQDEIFGPITDIIPFGDLDEAIKINNEVPYGLVTSVHTRDLPRAFHAIDRISSGVVSLNAPTVGAEAHVPWGGARGSGNGYRDGGQVALEAYTEWKSVYIDYSGQLQRPSQREAATG